VKKNFFWFTTYKILKFGKFCAFICLQFISILIMKEVISFLKKLAENDDLRKRDDLRDFYGTYTAANQLSNTCWSILI
jgi:hypothetical protein